jgi:hypothetical protein
VVSVSWNETFILGALGLSVIAAVLAVGDVLAQESRAKKPPSDVVHRLEHNGLSLEMAPLSFEQVSAFLVGRGLSKDDAELAARRGCIFRSALGNTATTPNSPHVAIKLEEWRILRPDKVPAKLGLREDWDMFWRARGLAEAPSVAFHWALFPSEQIFAPTDHNWGFLSFMLAPGMAFSLEVKWRTGGSPHSVRFDGLRCAS